MQQNVFHGCTSPRARVAARGAVETARAAQQINDDDMLHAGGTHVRPMGYINTVQASEALRKMKKVDGANERRARIAAGY